MNRENYIMTPSGGGIDKALFYPGSIGPFEGLSGFTLRRVITKSNVYIRGMNPEYMQQFRAYLDNETLRLDINNKNEAGTRHPDLYPFGLLKHSLEYFSTYGHDVNTFEAEWVESGIGRNSDNYDAYTHNLAAYTDQESPLNKITSARNTWTGHRFVEDLGFTYIEEPRYTKKHGKKVILVTFRKPQTAA